MRIQPLGIVVLCVAALTAASCKNDEACTKARFSASSAWKAVMETAGKNEVAPNIGLDELPDERKGEHVATWGSIEKYAELVSVAFAYTKITWNTASPAQQKATQAFESYFAKEKFRTFQTQLADANEKFAATRAACGD
jgi:hypothetical protein